MIHNYLKIVFRIFSRHKLYTFINIFGLAIGIFVCLIIYLWIQKEMSYDRFHQKAGRIYRVERELYRENLYSRWPITSGAYKKALIDDFSEIENAVRFWRREFSIKDHKGITHRQQTFAVDNSIFDIFDFHLIEGDEKRALAEPQCVVLTKELAVRYFGTDNAIGHSLTFEWQDVPVAFKVTGILQQVPVNSHIQFDMLFSISSYPAEQFIDWRSNYLYTYILVKGNTDKAELEDKLKLFTRNRLEPHYGDLLVGDVGIHDVLRLQLCPITDIHLFPSVNWELELGGNMASVYIFASIAVLLLIIACLNFVNLSTARSQERAKEVGLRKTIGAGRAQLILQFTQESLFFAAVALAFAMFLLFFFLPVFNRLFSENLTINLLFQTRQFATVVSTTLVVGLAAGLYPAFHFASLKTVDALKAQYGEGGHSVFRRNIVVLQFIISVTMMVGMMTVIKQMNYIRTRDMGFDKENVLLIPLRSANTRANYSAFRNELVQNSQILSVAASADVPSDRIYGNTNYTNNEDRNIFFSMTNIYTDYDFVNTYKLELLAGRAFSRDFGADTDGTIMLNESAAKKFGWTPAEAVGKCLAHRYDQVGRIVGVVKDFNFKSVHTNIEPLVFLLSQDYIHTISVRVAPGHIDNTIDYIQGKWRQVFVDEQFEFSFLDDRLDQLYESEDKTKNIFSIFSLLSLFVACLGLIGLTAFYVERKTKEIGVRKVIGASIPSLLLLLIKDFIKWILLANIFAWPFAWLSMNAWLNNFAYRIELSPWIFLLAAVLALVTALLTVGFQVVKASYMNPVESLRYE